MHGNLYFLPLAYCHILSLFRQRSKEVSVSLQRPKKKIMLLLTLAMLMTFSLY